MRGESWIVGHASAEDSAVILDLLQENRLPVDGLIDHLATTVVAREAGRIVGSAALEMYDEHALLRSVAVSSAFQSRGLGRALTEAALAMARDRHVRAVYVLTTTAGAVLSEIWFQADPSRARSRHDSNIGGIRIGMSLDGDGDDDDTLSDLNEGSD
jgi:N-acetylglutamate synthase-like GNAT family acetyltransferase